MALDDIKAVAFDVDGTLITGSVWAKLHALFRISSDEHSRVFERYIEGMATFADWTRSLERAYLEHPAHRPELEELGRRFDFVPGAPKVVAALRGRYPLALSSSGFDTYVFPVAEALGITHAYAYSVLTYGADERFSGIRFARPEGERDAKVEDVKEFCAAEGILPGEVAFVGDSVNDLLAFEYTGHGILVGEGSKDLKEAAWKRVTELSELLDIL
jgi:HAD superfamily phosphoserine phosphatase-like hydrolase